METSTLLLLSALVSFLVLFAPRGVSALNARIKSATNEPIIRHASVPQKITRIFVPNVLARWPWPRRINPNYSVVKKEADAWIMSFQAFSPKAQNAFNRCDFSVSFPSYFARVPILFARSPRLFSISPSEQR